jgi:hypothetical protein
VSFEFGIEICRRLPAVALPFDVATFWKRCLSGLLGGSTTAAPNKSVETCTNEPTPYICNAAQSPTVVFVEDR